jgi:hypothetical protein
MPKDSLVIKLGWGATIGGETTVGHIKDGEAGRHYMMMGGASTDWDFGEDINAETVKRRLISVAHELGLLHEHKRQDRNDHVFYQCKMIVGYDAVLKRVLADGPEEEDICLNARIATKYGFAEFRFVQNGELVNHGTGSKDSDIDSIMHYTSENYAEPLKYMWHMGDPDWYLLVSKAGGGKQIIPEPPHFDVTDLDAKAIKAMYP